MDKGDKWIITFGTVINESNIPYYEVCDLLELKLMEMCMEKYGNCIFVGDKREGEAYSVRFEVISNDDLSLNPIAGKEISIGGIKYKIDVLEIRKFKEIYLGEFLNDLLECYEKNNNPFEDISFKIVSEAINSYEQEIYDGSVILFRTAIDSSVYMACIWTRSEKNENAYEYRTPRPFNPKNNVSWEKLSAKAMDLGLLENEDIKKINEIRDLGNFAAHLGERQLKEGINWLKKNRKLLIEILENGIKGKTALHHEYPSGYKLYTSKYEAYRAIESTVEFLKKLSINYNSQS